MNPRGRIHSLSSLKAEGIIVVEHDAVQPDLMSRLMKDLESPEANPRAAELFAKRRAALQKLEEEQLKAQTPVICFKPLRDSSPSQQPQQAPLNSSSPPSNSLPCKPSVQVKQSIDYTPKAVPLKTIQPTVNSNNLNFNRPPALTAHSQVDTCNKRYSLLDPDIFVPSVTCNISSSLWLKSNSVKSPSPWKASTSSPSSLVKSVSPVQPAHDGEQSTRVSTQSQVCTSKPGDQLRHPLDSRVNTSGATATTAAAATTTNVLGPFNNNNNINSNSNNADNYYNYFYQTLKYSNPYQNLPESILL